MEIKVIVLFNQVTENNYALVIILNSSFVI